MAFIGGLFTLEYLPLYLHGLHGSWPFPQDGLDYVLGRDFLNTWFYGKAAWTADPGRFYDQASFMAWVRSLVPQDIFDRVWSYPPQFLLFAAPFGLMPYPVALATWTLLGMLALYLAVPAKASPAAKLAIMCSPATIFCLVAGQVSLFMAAALIVSLRLMDRRPWRAGLLLAVLTIKPQVALVIPVYLVLSRRWRVLAGAALGGIALVAVTAAIYGIHIWTAYIFAGIPAQMADSSFNFMIALPYSPTIASAAAIAGLSPVTGNIVQLSFAALAVGLLAFARSKAPIDLALEAALLLASSVFATPYMLSHDLVAVTAALVLLASTPLEPLGRALTVAMFALPLLLFGFNALHLAGAALIPVAFAIWATRAVARGSVADSPAAERALYAGLSAAPSGIAIEPNYGDGAHEGQQQPST